MLEFLGRRWRRRLGVPFHTRRRSRARALWRDGEDNALGNIRLDAMVVDDLRSTFVSGRLSQKARLLAQQEVIQCLFETLPASDCCLPTRSSLSLPWYPLSRRAFQAMILLWCLRCLAEVAAQ